MFDCDGDRRDFAKQQYQDFVSRMETGQIAPAPTTPDKNPSTDDDPAKQ